MQESFMKKGMFKKLSVTAFMNQGHEKKLTIKL